MKGPPRCVTALAVGWWSAVGGYKASAAQTACAVVLEAQLPTPDTMVVHAAQPDCGQLRLVVMGPAQRVSAADPWWFSRLFEIPVAIENTGRTPINLPVAMSVDSSTPVQRGRQLNAFYSREYVAFPYWHGRNAQQPWRFRGPKGRETKLRPGSLTSVERLTVASWPLTQGFRVWFRFEGIIPRAPARTDPRSRSGPQPDTVPADSAAWWLADRAGLPPRSAIR